MYMDLRNPMNNNAPKQTGGVLLPAMVYFVAQPSVTQVYYPETALRQGTLFPELDKPFSGNRGAY